MKKITTIHLSVVSLRQLWQIVCLTFIVSYSVAGINAVSSLPKYAGLTFQLISYDCNSGVLHYQMTGGDGSAINVACPGAFAGTVYAGADNAVTIDVNLRNGTTFNGTATQSGQQVSITQPVVVPIQPRQ